jgi:hypothetical protein
MVFLLEIKGARHYLLIEVSLKGAKRLLSVGGAKTSIYTFTIFQCRQLKVQ